MDTSAVRFLQQENSRLLKENEALKQKIHTLRRTMDMVAEIYRVNQEIAWAENPLQVLDDLLGRVIEVIGAKDGSVSRLDAEAGELVFVLVHGALRNQLPDYRFKSDVGVAGWVVSNEKPIIVNQPRQDWRFSLEVDQEFSFLTRSIVCVPVLVGHQAIGVIELLNKDDNEFTEADVTLLMVLSQVAAAILQLMPLQPPSLRREVGDTLFGD
jgi:GAF domain-containing protein